MAYKFIKEELVTYLYSNKKYKRAYTMLKYRDRIANGLKDPEKFDTWKKKITL